jgi:hypothetical protein
MVSDARDPRSARGPLAPEAAPARVDRMARAGGAAPVKHAVPTIAPTAAPDAGAKTFPVRREILSVRRARRSQRNSSTRWAAMASHVALSDLHRGQGIALAMEART